MASSTTLPKPTWYKVDHPEFDPSLAYRALAYLDYGETAQAQLLFINDRGMTYAVRNDRCVCLNLAAFCRPLRPPERATPFPRPRGKNPDNDTDEAGARWRHRPQPGHGPPQGTP